MSRVPLVPAALMKGPFGIAEARRHGLTEDHLRGASWRRIGRDLYVHQGLAENPLVRMRAAMCRLPEGAVFSGPTAAFLHGLDSRCAVIEATIPPPTRISRRVGINIKRRRLTSDEVGVRKGMPVTSPIRTVIDLCVRLDLVEAVVVLDAALHKKVVRLEDVRACARLREVVDLAEPATASPMETRLRLLLVLAGLPRPKVQVSLGDATSFLGRVDLYYPEHRLAIEYDGATHRDSLASDNRRQNKLLDAGYRILRFTASDVLDFPQDVIALVRSAISATDPEPLPKHRPRLARSAPRRGPVAHRAA